MIEGDASGLGPIGQRMGNELRAVVHPNRQRGTTHLHQLVQGPDDPRSGQAGVNLDAQHFPVELVDDIESAEPATRPQCIRHEVTTPALVGLFASLQGLPYTCRQPLLASPWEVEIELAIHPPQHRLAPGLVLVAGADVQQTKAMPWISGHVGLHEMDYPGVVALLVAVAQCGASDAAADSPPNLLIHYVPNMDAEGQVHGIIGMVLDRTEQHVAQTRLAASERQLRAVTDNLPVLIYYLDTQERLGFLNATFREWLGVDLVWATGRTLQEVIGGTLYEQRRGSIHRAMGGGRMEFEVESVFNGKRRHLETAYVPDVWTDGTVRGIFALSTDITELKDIELELRQLVRVDSLTGLPNRMHFDGKLQKAIARSRRTGSTMALMFLDVDHFKSINDSLGHGAGDQVLCEFANRIRSALRISDMAARLAGDEFVIVLEDVVTNTMARFHIYKAGARRRPLLAHSGFGQKRVFTLLKSMELRHLLDCKALDASSAKASDRNSSTSQCYSVKH